MRWPLCVLLGSATAAASPCDLDGLHVDPARVMVTVEPSGAALVARVTFDDGGHVRGPRVLEATSCAELIDAIALVIAMGQPADPPPARTDDALAVRATVASRPTNEIAISVGGAAGVSSHGGGQQLAAGVEWQHGAIALGLELRRDAAETVAIAPGGQVASTTTAGALVACRRSGAAAACGVVEVGAIGGTGSGLFDARPTLSPLVAGGVQLRWDVAFGARFALRLSVEGDVRATTTRFDVDHMAVWTSSRFEVWAGAALLAHFP